MNLKSLLMDSQLKCDIWVMGDLNFSTLNPVNNDTQGNNLILWLRAKFAGVSGLSDLIRNENTAS